MGNSATRLHRDLEHGDGWPSDVGTLLTRSTAHQPDRLVAMPVGLDGHPGPIRSTERTELLAWLGRLVLDRAVGRCLVGIDGASGTGRSTFADELATVLADSGQHVVRASIDSFHRPRAERYRLGDASAEGYYRDSHDLVSLWDRLLGPFGSGATSAEVEVFDEPTDRPIHAAPIQVPPTATRVFYGLFLHRPELVDAWSLSVFLVADQRR